LAEDFYAEDVGDAVEISGEFFFFGGLRFGVSRSWAGLHLLGFTLQIRVHDCDVVVATDNVSEC
jgi:hypothetical protein